MTRYREADETMRTPGVIGNNDSCDRERTQVSAGAEDHKRETLEWGIIQKPN